MSLRFTLLNSASDPKKLIVEPWGNELTLSPSEELNVIVEADTPTPADIEIIDDGIVVTGRVNTVIYVRDAE